MLQPLFHVYTYTDVKQVENQRKCETSVFMGLKYHPFSIKVSGITIRHLAPVQNRVLLEADATY